MLENWDSSFPGCEPIAHKLKHGFPDRRVRFHSLPESKRYPEDENDFEILLSRHNAILAELAHPPAAVVLLVSDFSIDNPRGTVPAETPNASWWRTIVKDEDSGPFHLYSEQTIWQPKNFDAIIRGVAVDAIGNLMICDPACRWLLHPYDGGMDVILSDRAHRDALKRRFREWLSARGDGR